MSVLQWESPVEDTGTIAVDVCVGGCSCGNTVEEHIAEPFLSLKNQSEQVSWVLLCRQVQMKGYRLKKIFSA